MTVNRNNPSTVISVLIFMLFLHFTRGEEIEVPIAVGKNITLLCSFPPGTVVKICWFKENLTVICYYNNTDHPEDQDKHFSDRASLFPDQFSTGNASLHLRRVQDEDKGRYECAVETKEQIYWSYVRLKLEDSVNGSHPETTPSSGSNSTLRINKPGNSIGDEDNPGGKGLLFWVVVAGVIVVTGLVLVVAGVVAIAGAAVALAVYFCKKIGQRRNNQPGAATDVEMEHFNPDRPTPDGHNGVNAL